jgi:phospholipase C
LPETERALALAEQRAMILPAPTIPTAQTMPRQEPGSRPRRA